MQPEEHKELPTGVKDIVLGLSDGLTVPFAIAAGLAGIAASSGIIIVAAILSEMAAGAISMGLGGYLAANTEVRHYDTEYKKQKTHIDEHSEFELDKTKEIFEKFGIPSTESLHIATIISQDKNIWTDFMMRFEVGLDKPSSKESIYSGLRIGLAYAFGGLFPLIPYAIFYNNVPMAVKSSIVVTFIALVVFGFVRAKIIGDKPWWSIIQTVLLVGIAAGAAFVLAKVAPQL